MIFKSDSTHSPTREKVTTSNLYNLIGNLCEKHLTPTGNHQTSYQTCTVVVGLIF